MLVAGDGTRYEGGWKAGKFEGDGVLVQARRRPLRGRLRRRAPRGARAGDARPTATSTRAASPPTCGSGAGTLTTAGGYRYSGAWVDGRLEGEGKVDLSRRLDLRGRLQGRPARGTRRDGLCRRHPLRGRLEGRRDRRAGHRALCQRPDLRGRVRRRAQPRPGQAHLGRTAIPTRAAGSTGCARARRSSPMPTAPATRAASRRGCGPGRAR